MTPCAAACQRICTTRCCGSTCIGPTSPSPDLLDLRHKKITQHHKLVGHVRTLSACADDVGGSTEGYVKWCCEAVHRAGYRAVVLNYRGCGGLTLTTERCYNAVFTDDIHEVVHYLRRYAIYFHSSLRVVIIVLVRSKVCMCLRLLLLDCKAATQDLRVLISTLVCECAESSLRRLCMLWGTRWEPCCSQSTSQKRAQACCHHFIRTRR